MSKLAWAVFIVADVAAFLPAPFSRGGPLERTCDRPRQPPWGSSSARETCGVVQRAAPLRVEQQRQQQQKRSRAPVVAGALYAVRKGRKAGGQKQQQQQLKEEEEEAGELGSEEDAAAVEAMRLEKLAKWKAMMQSGEVRVVLLMLRANVTRCREVGWSCVPMMLWIYVVVVLPKILAAPSRSLARILSVPSTCLYTPAVQGRRYDALNGAPVQTNHGTVDVHLSRPACGCLYDTCTFG